MRTLPARTFAGGTLRAANTWLASQKDLPPLLDIELSLAVSTASAPITLTLTTGPNEHTDITVNSTLQQLAFDRTHSGTSDFFTGFAATHTAPLRIGRDGVHMRLLLDASSLEVFAQEGETVLTELIFPTGSSRTLSISESVATTERVVRSITIHPLTAPHALATKSSR